VKIVFTVSKRQKKFSKFNSPPIEVSLIRFHIKIKALWDELDMHRTLITYSNDKEHQEEREMEKLMQFLMGLNDSYKVI